MQRQFSGSHDLLRWASSTDSPTDGRCDRDARSAVESSGVITGRSGRRRFLKSLAANAALTGLASRLTSRALIAAESEVDEKRPEPNLPGKFRLASDESRDLFRVRIEMNVQGNVHVAKNPMASRDVAKKIPIRSDAVIDFEERFRRPEGAASGSVVTAAERYYHEAMSETKLSGTLQRLSLREPVRSALVRRDSLPETIYAAGDSLTHPELELLRTPASSVDVDRLLPAKAVGMEDRFTPDRDALCGVLNLSSIQQTDVEMKVVAVTKKIVRFEMQGDVTGSVAGVPTTMEVVGKLTYDRRAKMCYWLAMAVRETREVGLAVPGFEVTAELQMLRKPQAEAASLPEIPVKMPIVDPVPASNLLAQVGSDELNFTALMDRRWRTLTDAPGRSMMRMVDTDRSVAQCAFRPLASLGPGSQWTLEAFRQDVQRTLGEDLRQFTGAEQRLSDSGLRVLQVSAQGAVQGVPVQWVLLHFSDDSGRRLLASFTMDGESIEEFGGSAVQLADSLRFGAVASAAPSAGKSADVAANPPARNPQR